MAYLYPSISAMVEDIEAQSAKHKAEALSYTGTGKAHRMLAAGAMGRAIALREVARQMRDTYIGPDAAHAVPLIE